MGRPAPEWDALLLQYATEPPQIHAVDLLAQPANRLHTRAPLLMLACDGARYYVKEGTAGRRVCNEQFAGRIGAHFGVVPPVTLIHVPETVASETHGRFVVGSHHASTLIPDCGTSGYQYEQKSMFGYPPLQPYLPQNKSRFALLSVFFSLMHAGIYGGRHWGDAQVIFGLRPPHTVWSVDHEYCFAAGALDWTSETLASAPPATLEQSFWRSVATDEPARTDALVALGTLCAETIAKAVAAPPTAWGMTPAERVAICRYLWRRREELLAAHLMLAAA